MSPQNAKMPARASCVCSHLQPEDGALELLGHATPHLQYWVLQCMVNVHCMQCWTYADQGNVQLH